MDLREYRYDREHDQNWCQPAKGVAELDSPAESSKKLYARKPVGIKATANPKQQQQHRTREFQSEINNEMCAHVFVVAERISSAMPDQPVSTAKRN